MLAAFLMLQGLICANEKWEDEKKLKIEYVTKVPLIIFVLKTIIIAFND